MATSKNKVKELISEAKEIHRDLKADMLKLLDDIDSRKLTRDKIKEELLKIYKKLK